MPSLKWSSDGGALRWAYSLATLTLALLPLSAPGTGHNPGVPVVQIELDVFSGRPNLTWQLDDAQTIELLALLADLPIATQRKTEEFGYSGFLVYRPGPGGGLAAPVRVGSVAQHGLAGLKKVAGVRADETSHGVQIAPPDSGIQ